MGFWKYSRHPNYLGEALVWLGLLMLCAPQLQASGARWAYAGPLLTLAMIALVTGIVPLERHATERFGALREYARYKRRTGLLLPWIPGIVEMWREERDARKTAADRQQEHEKAL